jgi:hypothetical protein
MSRLGEAIASELAALPRRLGGSRGMLVWAFGVAVMGLLLPWQLGYDFVDIQVLLAYAMMVLLFVAPVVADSFAGEPERNIVPDDPAIRRDLLLGRVAAGVLYGWGSTMLMLALAFVTVNLRLRPAILLLPPATISLSLAVLTLLLAIFAASLAAAIAVRARDARSAKRSLRQGFLLLLVALILYLRGAPSSWRAAMGGLMTPDGMVRFTAYAAVTLLPVSAGLLRLAFTGWDRTEIRLDI